MSEGAENSPGKTNIITKGAEMLVVLFISGANQKSMI